MREMGFTSEFRRGYWTVVLKEEHNLNRLCIRSMVSCKGTMVLRSITLGLKSTYQLCDLGQVAETHLQQ